MEDFPPMAVWKNAHRPQKVAYQKDTVLKTQLSETARNAVEPLKSNKYVAQNCQMHANLDL